MFHRINEDAFPVKQQAANSSSSSSPLADATLVTSNERASASENASLHSTEKIFGCEILSQCMTLVKSFLIVDDVGERVFPMRNWTAIIVLVGEAFMLASCCGEYQQQADFTDCQRKNVQAFAMAVCMGVKGYHFKGDADSNDAFNMLAYRKTSWQRTTGILHQQR